MSDINEKATCEPANKRFGEHVCRREDGHVDEQQSRDNERIEPHTAGENDDR